MNDSALNKKYTYWRWRTMYSMYIGYACFYLTRKTFTFVTPLIMQNLSFNKEQIGLLSTIFYCTYGMSKFFNGLLSDRMNPKNFMAIGLLVTGLINIVFGFSSSLIFFTLLWFLNGIFQGYGWPPCVKLLTHWFSLQERGLWWGIWNTSHAVSMILVPIISALAATLWGWRIALLIAAFIAVPVSFWLWKRIKGIPEDIGLPPIEQFKNDYPTKDRRIESSVSTKEILVKYILRNKIIWLLMPAYALTYLIQFAVIDWSSLYLTSKGYSLLAAACAASFLQVGGFVGSLVAGIWSDKFFAGKRGPVNVLFSIGLLVMIIIFYNITIVNFMFLMVIAFGVGIFMFGPQMLIGMAAAELSHREAAGTATGFIAIFAYAGAALSGYPLGFISQHYGWLGFSMTVIVSALLLVLVLIPTWSKVKIIS